MPQTPRQYWISQAFVFAALFVGLAAFVWFVRAPEDAQMSILGPIQLVVLAILLLGIYLLPSLVAGRRRHVNLQAILALNILVGWTFLGWVLALVWALTVPRRPAS